ncbi:MAG: DinB family protein [Nocardiopsaceae bacterium]|jgi:hypothetical protein|nr:DinB family protein [Nocardiopsaceae bacterium]
MTAAQDWDRQLVHDELERARTDFHHLLSTATKTDLTMPTDGTRWNNEQLLFHMLFGYMIALALLGLVRMFGRLPSSANRTYARLLNATARPFHVINYLGPCAAVHVYGHQRMGAKFDRVIASLQRHLSRETAAELARGMHYPARWDPFFKDYMTLADLYRYPTQHYDFHRRQLTIKA